MARRYVIEVDGESFDVEGESGVFELLDQINFMANEDDFDIEVIKPPRIRVKTGSGKLTKSRKILQKAKDTRNAVLETYKRRSEEIKQQRTRDKEISQLMTQKLRDEDEDDAIIALLL